MKAFLKLALTLVVSTVMSLCLWAALVDIAALPSASQSRVTALRGLCMTLTQGALLVLFAVWLLRSRLRHVPYTLVSAIDGHAGQCVPIWLNKNRIDYMTTGAATGFFRRGHRLGPLPLVWLSGPEFHGYIREDRVLSTEGAFGRVPS